MEKKANKSALRFCDNIEAKKDSVPMIQVSGCDHHRAFLICNAQMPKSTAELLRTQGVAPIQVDGVEDLTQVDIRQRHWPPVSVFLCELFDNGIFEAFLPIHLQLCVAVFQRVPTCGQALDPRILK